MVADNITNCHYDLRFSYPAFDWFPSKRNNIPETILSFFLHFCNKNGSFLKCCVDFFLKFMGATHLIRIGPSVARHVVKECVTVTGRAQIPSRNSVDMAAVALDLLLTRCHVSEVAKVRL